MGLLRRVRRTCARLDTRISGAGIAGRHRPPTVVQEFAARRPVVLALCASTPIAVVMALAARPVLGTADGVLFVLANWALVASAFALTGYAERARQRRRRRHRADGV
ncbi:hypothetical protein [Streptomyces sp. CRN 30]|uniref:hypothetical protein n=1 Tax=Streptomyces sp. CRN 30 TaxID=3075613 RepID=UPI002A7EC186|nr:hypothetical protein [Streptomyces sp. CRN 30]